MELGLHASLGVPEHIKIYLDNGAFYFLRNEGEAPRKEYEEFVREAKPDWYPIPQDYIPTPKMTPHEQQQCLERTMDMNYDYEHNGFVPVIHISRVLDSYIYLVNQNVKVAAKPFIALGGIVPNLLRAPKALSHDTILENLRRVRQAFSEKQLHLFGVGGTATLHIAALLGMDSVDSSGWRNRAARGMIQLPGTGERIIAELGKWRGRQVNSEDLEKLETCPCPACQQYGVDGLRASKISGFCNRATHNLWVLLNEAQLVEEHLAFGDYEKWYTKHLDNTIYRPLIEKVLKMDSTS